MKKNLKRKSIPFEAQGEQDVVDLIYKMQQQLNSLEKKIDTLINQPRFDNSRRFNRGSRDNNYRERSFTKAICAECQTECEVPFKPTGDRPVYCKDCFAKRKEGGGSFKAKFEHNPRENDFSKGHNFDRTQGRENRSPGGRRKPNFRRRKGCD